MTEGVCLVESKCRSKCAGGKEQSKMKNEEMARLFSEATPYIQKYHGKTMVVKYGGNAMINEELKNAVMNDLVTAGNPDIS